MDWGFWNGLLKLIVMAAIAIVVLLIAGAYFAGRAHGSDAFVVREDIVVCDIRDDCIVLRGPDLACWEMANFYQTAMWPGFYAECQDKEYRKVVDGCRSGSAVAYNRDPETPQHKAASQMLFYARIRGLIK